MKTRIDEHGRKTADLTAMDQIDLIEARAVLRQIESIERDHRLLPTTAAAAADIIDGILARQETEPPEPPDEGNDA
ncbi:MAG: hypothetical protein HQ581_22400 [Planctomycetes bacterium]|nr:hypothetical protein [Planctomycetota bacterium]